MSHEGSLNNNLSGNMMEKVEDDGRRDLLSLDDFRGFATEGWTSLDFLDIVTKVALDRYEEQKQQTRRMKQVITSEPMTEHGKPEKVMRETDIKPTRECLSPKKRFRVVFRGEVPESSRAVKKPREDVTRGGIDLRLGPNRDVPLDVKEYIDGMGGENIQLVCQKTLTESDVKKNQNRLLMPHTIIMSPSFPREDERELLKSRVRVHVSELRVPLLEPELTTCVVSLRNWAMAKGEGKRSTVYYVLAGGWNGIVSRNNLKDGDIVQLWSFRVDSDLHLALVAAHNI